jgi:hypothetical protein
MAAAAGTDWRNISYAVRNTEASMRLCFRVSGFRNLSQDANALFRGLLIVRYRRRLATPNEKEISHGRVLWQARSAYFGLGALTSSIG